MLLFFSRAASLTASGLLRINARSNIVVWYPFLSFANSFYQENSNKKAPSSIVKDDNAEYVLPWCHLASFMLNSCMSYETCSCPVTGATVYVSHAGLQVDFAFADHCVAPTHSSLYAGQKLLVLFFATLVIRCPYQHSSRDVFCQWFLRLKLYKKPLPGKFWTCGKGK